MAVEEQELELAGGYPNGSVGVNDQESVLVVGEYGGGTDDVGV